MSKRKGYGQEALTLLKRLCWEQRIKVVWTYPLAKGMYGALRDKLPADQISNKKIFAALCYHTGTPAYLSRMTKGNFRLGIGGVKTEPVTEAEAELAKKTLAKFAKRFLPKSKPRNQKPKTPTKRRRPAYAK